MKNLVKLVLSATVLISSVSYAGGYYGYVNIQVCKRGDSAINCSSASPTNALTSNEVYQTLTQAQYGCSLTETKASVVNSADGVDTYKCESGELKGYSALIFYDKSTDHVSNLIVY